MSSNINTETISRKIDEKLFNYPSNLLNNEMKQFGFEQYKLIVDSAHKLEERRNGSNNIFIAMNSIFITILTQIVPYPEIKLEKLIILSLLLPIGVLICWDWLRTIEAYKKINFINYSLINKLEKSLPTLIFSLRTDIMATPDPSSKANTILKKEPLLPIVFMSIYLLYFIVIIVFMILT